MPRAKYPSAGASAPRDARVLEPRRSAPGQKCEQKSNKRSANSTTPSYAQAHGIRDEYGTNDNFILAPRARKTSSAQALTSKDPAISQGKDQSASSTKKNHPVTSMPPVPSTDLHGQGLSILDGIEELADADVSPNYDMRDVHLPDSLSEVCASLGMEKLDAMTDEFRSAMAGHEHQSKDGNEIAPADDQTSSAQIMKKGQKLKALPPPPKNSAQTSAATKGKVQQAVGGDMNFEWEYSQLFERATKLEATAREYLKKFAVDGYISISRRQPTLDLQVDKENYFTVWRAKIIHICLRDIQNGLREEPVDVFCMTQMIEVSLKFWHSLYNASPPPDLVPVIEAMKSIAFRINGQYAPPSFEEITIKRMETEVRPLIPKMKAAYQETSGELNAIKAKATEVEDKADAVIAAHVVRKRKMQQLEEELKALSQEEEYHLTQLNAAEELSKKKKPLMQSFDVAEKNVNTINVRSEEYETQMTEVDQDKEKINTLAGPMAPFVLSLDLDSLFS